MSIHRCVGSCLSVVLGAVLVWPVAAGAQSAPMLTIGPLKVRRYAMSVIPECGKGGCGAAILFSRAIGKGSQTHTYPASKAKITVASLRSAKETATFGSLGKLTLVFHASAVKRGKVPKGCKGNPGKVAIGTVKGTFKLNADAGYFRTIIARRLPATVSTAGTITCAPPGGGKTLHSVYFGVNNAGPLDPSFLATRSGRTTTINATAAEQRGGILIRHSLIVSTTASHLVTPTDLSSATLRGAGALKGTASATFGTGTGAQTTAPLTGQLTARFDSLGPVKLITAATRGYVTTG